MNLSNIKVWDNIDNVIIDHEHFVKNATLILNDPNRFKIMVSTGLKVNHQKTELYFGDVVQIERYNNLEQAVVEYDVENGELQFRIIHAKHNTRIRRSLTLKDFKTINDFKTIGVIHDMISSNDLFMKID